MSEVIVTHDVDLAVHKLLNSHLCAIPTETVYGLAANALDQDAIGRVFAAKGRPTDHPLIVHVAHADVANQWITEFPDWAVRLTNSFWPGPLTIVGNRSELASDVITGGQQTVAVRVPEHPLVQQLLHKLLEQGVLGIVAPSANKFGHVSPTTAEHVMNDLGAYLGDHDDVILDGGICPVGIESTIILATTDTPIILRPGIITPKQIQKITGLKPITKYDQDIRVSGNLAAHYSPNARVEIVQDINTCVFSQPAGFLATSEIETPPGLTRLASPGDAASFAATLYGSLRHGDILGLPVIYIVVPSDDEIGIALFDRISRAAHQEKDVHP